MARYQSRLRSLHIVFYVFHSHTHKKLNVKKRQQQPKKKHKTSKKLDRCVCQAFSFNFFAFHAVALQDLITFKVLSEK